MKLHKHVYIDGVSIDVFNAFFDENINFYTTYCRQTSVKGLWSHQKPNLSDWLAISFQLGIGQTIVNKEKEKIRQELEAYAKGIFACAIKHPASGVGYASQQN